MSDVELLQRDITRMRRILSDIECDMADLHGIAYEKASGSQEPTSGTRRAVYLDEVGSPQAKAVWRQILDAMKRLEAAAVGMHNLMHAGPAPDDTMRGTLISRAEYDSRLASQRNARARGEQVPHTNPGVTQPAYPSPDTLCAHCHQRVGGKRSHVCDACRVYVAKYGKAPSDKIVAARVGRA